MYELSFVGVYVYACMRNFTCMHFVVHGCVFCESVYACILMYMGVHVYEFVFMCMNLNVRVRKTLLYAGVYVCMHVYVLAISRLIE